MYHFSLKPLFLDGDVSAIKFQTPSKLRIVRVSENLGYSIPIAETFPKVDRKRNKVALNILIHLQRLIRSEITGFPTSGEIIERGV